MRKRLSIGFILLFMTIGTFAQKQNDLFFFLDMGGAQVANKETHYTSNFNNGLGYHVNFGFEKMNEKSMKELSISFMQSKLGLGNISTSNILVPQIRYSYFKKAKPKGLFVGSYVDVGSLLNFRQGLWSSENSINYTIWSSLGISSQYQRQFQFKKRPLKWSTTVSAPIVSYLIRPSYTFPYPDNYLQNDVFNFDRSGLGSKVLTSGKVVSMDQFLNVRLQTGLSIPFKRDKWEMGINYQLNFLQTGESKPLLQGNHMLNLSTKYRK